jgi:GNAT superfamily N-acetyltransferase
MKLSTIAATLAELGAKPTQSLGQNFLHDQNLARWIVEQVDIQPDEPWVEVGPGLGALTEFALERSTNGLLLEKDDRLIAWLREQGLDRLWLTTGADTRASRFYEKAGWRRAGLTADGELLYELP